MHSFYANTADGRLTLSRDLVSEALSGRASINEVTSFMGIFRENFKEEFKQLRLGTGVANLKVTEMSRYYFHYKFVNLALDSPLILIISGLSQIKPLPTTILIYFDCLFLKFVSI